MTKQIEKSLVLSIYLILAVSALLVFRQVGNFDFVNYDDNIYVYKNPHVLNGLSIDDIRWAFTTGYANFWHPLTWLSHMLDWQLFGGSAGEHHLTNLIFHIANTLLLFIVLRQMTSALWQSAFVAALFALHPLHVESVAWISERKDVLSTFFWILTMWAYLLYVKKPDAGRYVLVLLIFALGLMAKPMLVTLPFVLLLLDYWPLERFEWKRTYRLIIEKIPFIVLAAVSSAIAFFVQQRGGAIMPLTEVGFKFRLCNVLISYIKYIEKMVWPSRLAVFYPHPGQNVSVVYALISAGLLLAATVLVIRYAKNHRYLVTGWFWYLGTLVPVIGLVQVGQFAMADRYTYITLTGLFIIIAWSLPELLAKLTSASSVESPQRKIVLGSAMVLVLTSLGICAHRQAGFWDNGITLFSHTIEVTQNNYIAYTNLGAAYGRLGRYQEEIDAYKQAIKIKPDYAMVHYNLGVTYCSFGRLQQAIDAFNLTITIKPDYAEAHYNLGVAYCRLGRSKEAIEAYKQAVKIRPDYAEAYYNLGNACSKLGRSAEAIEAYKQAVKIRPGYADAHANLGDAYLMTGDKNSAIAEYSILRSLSSQFADELLNRINK